ncbi:unnamed protein product, partial [Mesorhabditis belari]|uniref:Uncharacterized protein n=1 Tax=Mesorhabditis belari TaxID=2138241 RepID=A0AAF3J2G0_9BILA
MGFGDMTGGGSSGFGGGASEGKTDFGGNEGENKEFGSRENPGFGSSWNAAIFEDTTHSLNPFYRSSFQIRQAMVEEGNDLDEELNNDRLMAFAELIASDNDWKSGFSDQSSAEITEQDESLHTD